MSVLGVQFMIECDGCGTHFRVHWVDLARTVPAGWSLHEVAEEAVRNGYYVTPNKTAVSISDSTSVQDGKLLCPACTRAADAASEDDDEIEPDKMEHDLLNPEELLVKGRILYQLWRINAFGENISPLSPEVVAAARGRAELVASCWKPGTSLSITISPDGNLTIKENEAVTFVTEAKGR